MNNIQKYLNRSLIGAALAPLAIGLIAGATPAYAQVDPAQAQAPAIGAVPAAVPTNPAASSESASSDAGAIIVTGSRIQRRDLTSAAPLTTVSQEEFKLRGAVNVESVINELPSVIPGFTAFSNNPGTGAATLNLRNLGAQRTLVLVNGRRYMFFDDTQEVDLNTIPSFLIDSVDVETGGASAVYGSDAIAGVVNFKLKNLKGFEAGTQYGITQQGDGARWDSHVALGGEFADGRGHATVYGEYYQRKAIYQRDRSFSDNTLTDDGAGGFGFGGSGTNAAGRFGSGAASAAGTPFDLNSNTYGYGATFDTLGGVPRAFGDGTGGSPNDLYNYAPANYLQIPQKRWIMGGYGDYEISDHATAYMEFTYANNRVDESLAPTPVTGTFDVSISANAKYLNPAAIADLYQISGGADIVSLSVARRVNEVGNRTVDDDRNAFRIVTGLRGDITDKLHYDAYYSYARTRDAEVENGNVSRSAFQTGLLDGTLDIFGAGGIDAAGVKEISILSQNQNISVLQVATASVNGSLFNLGTGADDVAFAVGGEYRSVHSQFIPDTALSSGDVIGFNAGEATAGGYNVKEAFAELDVPLLQDRPFFKKLDVHGAGRYSSYSLGGVGNVWTYAGDVKWAPVSDVTFRAQYQHAVRAPNVGELYGGLAQGFPEATDPCATAAATVAGGLQSTCLAAGVPAAALGKSSLQPDAQIQSAFGGNPNLAAEKSNSYTFGAAITPSFIPRFHATVDYFHIKVNGAVSEFGGGVASVLNLCYNVIQDINSAYCQAVKRNPTTGIIDGSTAADGTQYIVTDLNANVATLTTSGVDFAADYTQPLNFGLMGSTSKLNFSFQGTLLHSFTTIPGPGLDPIKCKGKFGTTCGDPDPKFKSNVRLSYLDGPLVLSLAWHHLSSVHDDGYSGTYTVEKIKSYNTYDLAASFDIGDNYTLTAGMNNMLNKKPPLLGDNQQQANTYPSTYDVLGRDFFIAAGVKF